MKNEGPNTNIQSIRVIRAELLSSLPRFDHLKEGISPIITAVGTYNDFRDHLEHWEGKARVREEGQTVFLRRRATLGEPIPEPDAHNINYNLSYQELKEKGFEPAEEAHYVFSSIDSRNKLSEGFVNCTSLLVAGQSKETDAEAGKNISFLTHQDPWYFVSTPERTVRFISDLEAKLDEIKQRCVEGTIDARFFGGTFRLEPNSRARKDYLASVALLASEVKKNLGFEPLGAAGPKTHDDKDPTLHLPSDVDDVIYENDARRLYLVRPEVGKITTEPFMPKDIDKWAVLWDHLIREEEAAKVVRLKKLAMLNREEEA